jgi:hypothetical protein
VGAWARGGWCSCHMHSLLCTSKARLSPCIATTRQLSAALPRNRTCRAHATRTRTAHLACCPPWRPAQPGARCSPPPAHGRARAAPHGRQPQAATARRRQRQRA